jgi:hypothetical protein
MKRWKEPFVCVWLEHGAGGCHGTIQEGVSEHVEEGRVTEDDRLIFNKSSFSASTMQIASFDLSDTVQSGA